VRVHLHTSLRRRGPEGPVRMLEVDLPAGATLAELLRALDFQGEKHLLLVVNGRTAQPAQALGDADEVHLIPALSGG